MTQNTGAGKTLPKFDILNFLDKLTSDGGSVGKNQASYQCPVCGSGNFKIEIDGPKRGKYQTWGCDCAKTEAGKQKIRNAIAPLSWEKPTREKKSVTFTYHMEDSGNAIEVAQVRRADDGTGKRKFSQWHKDGARWVSGLPDAVKERVHLYQIFEDVNQSAIANGLPVLIVEGEGKVDQLLALGIAATCSIGGAGKWTQYGYQNYLKDLDGANVVICPDRDEPGIKHAELIAEDFPAAKWLYPNPSSYLWSREIPKNKGFDIGDWIDDGATAADIVGAIGDRRQLVTEPEIITMLPPAAAILEKPEKRQVSDQLIDIGRESNISYFMTSEEIVYADVLDGVTRRTLAIREKGFRQYLRIKYFQTTNRSPASEAVTQAIDILEALATRDAERRDVHVRLAEHEGRVYIDLADDSWKAIEVSRDGWKLVSDAPVRFTRGACSPLPIPIEGGRVEDFKELCQFDETQWVLILCFLLQGLKPEKAYPILLLHGGPQAGKSTITRAIKNLIDPSIGRPRKSVGEIRDFAIHATKRHFVGIDNLSGLSSEQSDILCTASTGGGHSQRTLQSDSGETIINFTNLLILNGIDTIATRGDLLSRSFPITIHPPKQRLSEAKFETRFTDIHPAVLGALLTLLSKCLAALIEIEGTYTGDSERFVGFVELGLALEQVENWTPGTFLSVIAGTRDEAHETAIESSPIGQALQDMMSFRDVWQGTASELLSELKNQVSESAAKSKYFPQNPSHLSRALTRLSADLKAIGIDCNVGRTTLGRFVTLTNPKLPSLPSLLS